MLHDTQSRVKYCVRNSMTYAHGISVQIKCVAKEEGKDS